MSKFTRQQLITYAVVSQDIDGINDFLSGLMPFFDPIISEMSGQLFDPKSFMDRLASEYEWPVNYDVAEDLIPRLKAAGRIEEINRDGEKGAYVCKAVHDPEIEQRELSAEEDLDRLGERFKGFCDDHPTLFTLNKSAYELGNLLLNFVVAVEGFDRNALLDAVEKLLEKSIDEPSGEDEVDDEYSLFIRPNLRTEESYLCARFINDLSSSSQEDFNALIDVASVALLTEVVLSVRNPPDAERKAADLVVILDAPLIMDALGLSGIELRERIEYIINSLRAMDAKVWAFNHSCGEIKRNLAKMFELHPHERYGYTANAILKGEVMEDFARAVMADPAEHIENQLGFQIIRQELDDFPNSHKYFSDEFFEEFSDRALWHEHPDPRKVDAMSVALIMRRRANNQTNDFFKSKFIMLSRNWLFVEFAKRFCNSHGLIEGNDVGPITTVRNASALIMLTLGYQGKKEIVRRQLLGACERVLRIKPNVSRAAWSKVKEIKPELLKQYEALLSRPRSVQVLADRTLNVERALKNDEIEGLVKLMENSLGEKYKAEADERHAQQEAEHKIKQDELNKQIDQKQIIIDNQSAEAQALKENNQILLHAWVKNINKWADRGRKIQIIALVGLAAIFSFTPAISDLLRWIGGLTAFAFALASLLPDFPNVLKNWISSQRIKWLRQKAMSVNRPDLLDDFDIDWETGEVSFRHPPQRSDNPNLFNN